MTTEDQLRQLNRIALLVRDRDLSRLSAATVQKNQTEALLAALDKTQSVASLDPIILGQVMDRFGLWTTNRRILLNQQLARATVTWMAARDEAQKSFGRAQVLDQMISKL